MYVMRMNAPVEPYRESISRSCDDAEQQSKKGFPVQVQVVRTLTALLGSTTKETVYIFLEKQHNNTLPKKG